MITLAAILWAATIAGGIALLRKALVESSIPRPDERNPQRAGDEVGEGATIRFHKSGDTRG
jgi:hypothetical protein